MILKIQIKIFRFDFPMTHKTLTLILAILCLIGCGVFAESNLFYLARMMALCAVILLLWLCFGE